jgi:UDP-N-acetylglucosamine 2-epimerase (hydrolysing)
VVYPSNDTGADIIIEEIELQRDNPRFRIFSSIRFESFLVLLKHCRFIIGNSSAGVREAPIYSIPAVNIGDRQSGRFSHETIINAKESKEEILKAIEAVKHIPYTPSNHFGDGNSTERFINVIKSPEVWDFNIQKKFIDIDY